MKIKKYTNSAWTDLDKPVKKYDTYTDEATTLPLTIQTSATDAVENYQVYGTTEGAGVETENIIVGIISSVNITQNGVIDPTTADAYECCIAPIENGKSYGLMTSLTENSTVYAFFDTYPTTNGRSYDSQRYVVRETRTVVIAPITGYLVIRGQKDYGKEMVIEGSTAPTTYIPFGYKIPISNSDGTNTSNYDLFLGDSKLYEDEYVDFSEQKVYKRTRNIFNKDDLIYGEWISTTGTTSENVSACHTDYIQINSNSTYKLVGHSADYSPYNTRVALYDANKSFLRYGEANHGTKTLDISTTNASYMRVAIAVAASTTVITPLDIEHYEITITEGSTAPQTYIPYLQPTDPPASFPTLHTYIGENNISVDTTVQPEKVVLTVAAWREIEAKKYQNEEWSDNNDT